MKNMAVDRAHAHERLLQALETERGSIRVYSAAIPVAIDESLRKEWHSYLASTRGRERHLVELLSAHGIDPETRSPARAVVAHRSEALVAAIELAVANGDPTAAQLVATECVRLAALQDHLRVERTGMFDGAAAAEELPVTDRSAEPAARGAKDRAFGEAQVA